MPGCAGGMASLSGVGGGASRPASGEVAASLVLAARRSSCQVARRPEFENRRIAPPAAPWSTKSSRRPPVRPGRRRRSRPGSRSPGTPGRRPASVRDSDRSRNLGGFLVTVRKISTVRAIGPVPFGPTTATAATRLFRSAAAQLLDIQGHDLLFIEAVEIEHRLGHGIDQPIVQRSRRSSCPSTWRCRGSRPERGRAARAGRS